MEYNFREIEKKWREQWTKDETYKVSNHSDKPKYYVLDMFPYPSGAGLHVGHPLGYIASDIFARYKRLKGFNVLHPMGYDAFGLPAEQYAIDHGIHPAVSTEKNINTFRKQLDNIGFCYDWSREVRTSDPGYYKWTQWIFLQLFKSWYNRQTDKAEPIENLVAIFEKEGNISHPVPNGKSTLPGLSGQVFTAAQWASFDAFTQQSILMEYRLAYCGYGEVNWCEALGTVLANDEVINGVSERGGFPVVKKKLRQWYLRITEYADRLQRDLSTVDWSDAMKEMQTNWIGKSSGAEVVFPLSISPLRGEGIEAKNTENMPGFGYAKYKVDSEMSFENAKRMRKEPTEAEGILWNELKTKKTGYKFRRQHPVENYIADFICLDVWVIVEVDGAYHDNSEQQKLDKERDAFLKEIGFTTLRFTNEEVTADIERVVKRIVDTCDEIKALNTEKRNAAGSSSPLRGEAGERGDEAAMGVRVYTTRPDTIFGVDFMVLAPEHELVEQITTPDQKAAVEEYVTWVKSRSERERMAEKKISGCFTGAYAVHPFTGRDIPIWISEYVLAGYGTGAIMAVPAGDERDHKFAQHFNIPVTNIFGDAYTGAEAIADKNVTIYNSDFITGLPVKEAAEKVINALEENGDGIRKVNYKMRDAAFSRQRYWGEPFPIIWKEGIAYPMKESELPLELPHINEIKPGKDGEGPLSNHEEWLTSFSHSFGGGRGEASTMPGYAGSSWYFLRYMDPQNNKTFCDRKASDYWNQVDLYIGGTEHAVGHLLYSRMWTKALYDLGYISFFEPFKKLVNQGMIQGSSRFVYRVRGTNKFISHGLRNQYETDQLHVDVNIVDGVELDIEKFKQWRNGEYANAVFILEDRSVYASPSERPGGAYICGVEVEKMSKSKFNTVNPDDLVNKYGADTFRMYEMFLGPVEQSKPWDTKGIEGVHRFLKKLWRLFYDEEKGQVWADETPTAAEWKVLHQTIKKIEEDTERFSFNTGVSAFMIAVNELTELKCHKKAILENMLILLTPYAPHIAEELWHRLGNEGSVLDAHYPVFEAKYVAETSKNYPVAINGKTRTELNLPLDITQEEVEKLVLENDVVQKWLEGNQPKKIIYVKNRMINVVV